MTAFNLWVCPAGAYLLSDQAFYHNDGTVLDIASKVSANDRLRVAVATSGTSYLGMTEEISKALDTFPTQAAALKGMPDVMRLLQASLDNHFARDGAETNGLQDPFVQALVAVWSVEHDRPEGYVIASAAGTMPPGYAPYSLRGVRCIVSPPTVGAPHPGAGGAFDPRVDGRRLIKAQRALRDAGGMRRVGGAAELIRVCAHRIERSIIWRWQDQIGEVIA